ncbi:hypothetical protein EYF80_049915 [Liparis tanakae]|uniref:Uncharacterized protein n=1 Tax=Liparis tanakae TaxID=230148 RepID=A0A4Z2FFB3_9TELE|nr:hypothetical protein EYF80_049915 [Liparis tanakae]
MASAKSLSHSVFSASASLALMVAASSSTRTTLLLASTSTDSTSITWGSRHTFGLQVDELLLQRADLQGKPHESCLADVWNVLQMGTISCLSLSLISSEPRKELATCSRASSGHGCPVEVFVHISQTSTGVISQYL